jgi:hypothetical protein
MLIPRRKCGEKERALGIRHLKAMAHTIRLKVKDLQAEAHGKTLFGYPRSTEKITRAIT